MEYERDDTMTVLLAFLVGLFAGLPVGAFAILAPPPTRALVITPKLDSTQEAAPNLHAIDSDRFLR
jgi:hypothetical protein